MLNTSGDFCFRPLSRSTRDTIVGLSTRRTGNYHIRTSLSDWSNESGISDIESADRRQLVDQITAKNPVLLNGKIRISGELRIENSTISSLPENLSVENLCLENCQNITSLPSSLQINDALKINNVPNLTTVENNFNVRLLKFENITNDQLAVMLSNISCDTLSIYNSTIASIPAGSNFRSLYLYHCQGPIILSRGNYQDIYFYRCPDLILSENLTGGFLGVSFDHSHPIAIPDSTRNGFEHVYADDLSSQSRQVALAPNDSGNDPGLEIRLSGMQPPAVTTRPRPVQDFSGMSFHEILVLEALGEEMIQVGLVDASTLPELVAKFGCDASHPLWTNAANQISDEAWNSFALFLSKFNDDMPGLKDEMKPILEAMQADYIAHGQPEAIQTEFISGVTNQATESTESCVDRVKLGFVAMQLKLAAHNAATPVDKQKTELALEKYQAIVRFVQSLGDFEIAYDKSEQQFIPVEIERDESSELRVSEIFQLKIAAMNADGKNIEAVCIRDEAEDALALLLKDETIKSFVSDSITVLFSIDVTLNEQQQTIARQHIMKQMGLGEL